MDPSQETTDRSPFVTFVTRNSVNRLSFHSYAKDKTVSQTPKIEVFTITTKFRHHVISVHYTMFLSAEYLLIIASNLLTFRSIVTISLQLRK